MKTPTDVFNWPLVRHDGHARTWAVRELRRAGHPIDPSLRGGSKVVGLYTDAKLTRGILVRRRPSGRLTFTRYGVLTDREIRFLHEDLATV